MAADQCELLCLDLPRAEALRARRLEPRGAARAAERASALGDSTRLTLLAALRDGGELCVCDLAWIVERSHNLVSHHMRVLRRADLVDARRDGKMVMYSLTGSGSAHLELALDGLAARA